MSHCALTTASTLGLGEELQGARQLDRVHIVLRGQGPCVLATLDEGAEAAASGNDFLVGFGIDAQSAGQREPEEGLVQGHFLLDCVFWQ